MSCRVSLPSASSKVSRATFLVTRTAFRHYQPIKAAPTLSRNLTCSTKMDASQAIKENNVPKKDQWKFRAPYRVHEPNEGFKARYDASCHCGKVKYQLSREEPLDSKLCHCTTCQTQHGELLVQVSPWESDQTVADVLIAAPFQWAAIFHKDDINFLHGHHDLEWYDPTEKSIEHKLPCKVRCAYCHSPIMDEGRNMILLFPSLIDLKSDEDKANFKPR